MVLIETAIPVPVFKSFVYESPEKFLIGQRLELPFGHRTAEGYVIGYPDSAPNHELKTIIGTVGDIPAFTPTMLELYKWISDYYHAPLGEVIRAGTPRIKEARQREKSIPASILTKVAPPVLTEHQAKVFEEIQKNLTKKKYTANLLHGVTGSGKTEIYMRAFDHVLQTGGSGILLVPEIALTPQLVSRFEERFPAEVVVLHSALSPAQRYRNWLSLAKGERQIAIGARSAIFAPLKNVGIIIVDEEHEGSFKQEEKLRYNARDVALVRGRLENATVILGSATPSLESYYNVQHKNYTYLRLPERIHSRPMPKVYIVDLRKEELSPPHHLISKLLFKKLQETMESKQQAMLLLNRRGYAAFLICRECGHVCNCPRCDVSLTVYRKKRALQCHYCRFTTRLISECPNCNGTEIQEVGFGTEQLEANIKELFPAASIERLDRTVARSYKRLKSVLTNARERKTDILIGTQLIAKGHDFPGVTLVGVVMADTALNLPDFRAAERTFQLLTQVAGRAGRGEQPGEVVIQTYSPQHQSIIAASKQDFEAFAMQELSHREELKFPPFERLVAIKVMGNSESVATVCIEKINTILSSIISKRKDAEILGPSPAPIYKLHNKYRWHLLLRAKSPSELNSVLKQAISSNPELFNPGKKGGVAVQIDVDPYGLM